MKQALFFLTVFVALLASLYLIRPFSSKIDFNTQVKPILNQRCISCHGGVKQSGSLSMMTRAELLKAGDSGNAAILPGKPNESELYQRLISTDEEERMPFEALPLPKEEIKILHQWIKEGAVWGKHWAYKSVEKVAVPKEKKLFGTIGKGSNIWAASPIDHFVFEKLQEQQLSPSSEANKNALLRRLSLDLIGLPAPTYLAETFLTDESEKAYENLVDSLLASPHFGERWASVWMDLARYADTKGAERDGRRNIWEYRDWLIRAFNQDMPYNQFLTEQIAGDLLPNPTDAQYIATGFHRNTVTNDEGGTDNEEFRLAAVVDRVNTTWEALMGTTFACTQCHGHPYDPIKHEEYYEFLAFFNNTRDHDTYADYPWLRKFSKEQDAQLEELTTWVKENKSLKKANEIARFLKTWQPIYYSLQTDSLKNADIYDTKFLGLRNDGIARLAKVDLKGKDQLIFRYSAPKSKGYWTLHLDAPNGEIIAKIPIQQTQGWQIQSVDFNRVLSQKHDLYLRYNNTQKDKNTRPAVNFDWFYFTEHFPAKSAPNHQKYKAIFWELLTTSAEHTLIMVENPISMRRETQVWDRGSWLVPLEKVEANVPDIFEPFPEDAPKNRLGLAMWLTDEQHPLTARTMVNRIWEQLFGRGLALTLEDLGTQGIPPTHPELLDYLSWQLMHNYEWSIKLLLKEIVLSATYRQDTKVSSLALEKDPDNEYYARMSRVRLSAEQIRDQSLAVSGLLSDKMYGESVMPYQPEGVWDVPYNNDSWKMSEGEDRYRRSLYTYWKRSAPYPAFLTFDAAPRQICNARRISTNTPLQALVTLNDPTFMEGAVQLAVNVVNNSSNDEIAEMYELATGSTITSQKLSVLHELYLNMKADFEKDAEGATELLQEIKIVEDRTKLAALAIVANAIMNLDEFITKS